MLYLYGRSGTTYLYIHLNNDLTARNDNKGGCVKDVVVRRAQRREGDGGPADRVERRLRRRERQPASPLRGAPERRRRRQPVPLPEASGEAALRRATRAASSASALRGKLVAAGAGAATLQVDRVRQYPGGRWLDIDPREVELTVPLGADVATVRPACRAATLRPLKKPGRASPRSRSRRTRRKARSSARRASSCSAVSHPRRSGRTSAEPVELTRHEPGASPSSCPSSTSARRSRRRSTTRSTAELPVPSRQLVIVDDGSTDGTRELLQSADWPENVKVVYHERNLGKGAAVRTALQHATRSSPPSSTPTSSTAPPTSPTSSSRSCRARRTWCSGRAHGHPSRRSASGT